VAEKILYYDCFAGISGDMNLAALIDLGVPADHLRTELQKLHLHGWTLKVSPSSKSGIHGTRVDVELENHGHSHDDHHHDHRTFATIRSLIEESTLSAEVKEEAIRMFRLVAEAEASVHGVAVDEVHFHEVGAVDSIIDIVGAAICRAWLNPSMILSSPIELGGGFVKCAHGTLPVPAPATARILEGVPVTRGATSFEMTTPTGGAILRAMVNSFTSSPAFVIKKTGYGVGHRDTEIPNLLRVFLAEMESPREGHIVLECNIDDMNPEFYSHIADLLFETGADDVWFTPVIMKKSRPAVTLAVLCSLGIEEKISSLLLHETTSLGLRKTRVEKTALERSVRTVMTSLGEVRVKSGYSGNERIKAKPEYEDCSRIAKEKGLSLLSVYEIIQKEI
jgi:uncharacterized protein (TIGR00299 family) protein